MLDDFLNGLPRIDVLGTGRNREPGDKPGELADLGAFGANPGALGAKMFVPARLRRGSALVVVLHGCTQDAAGYDRGAGWSGLAEANGFALLFPEQARANNPNRCFNWFQPDDTRRGGGEAASIAAMTRHMIAAHRIDPARVFVTGLSAGGAMASVMLAAYPELFAGGAIIAGLPFAGVAGVPRALEAMRVPTPESGEALAARVRAASPHTGKWPTISVWHGTADRTVAHGNADAILRQWAAVHRLSAAPTRVQTVDGQTHSVWRDDWGRTIIEDWRISGMGHGTPIASDGCGVAGPFMLDAGISSTLRIAAFWGIAPKIADRAAKTAPASHAATPAPRTRRLTPEPLDPRRAGEARPHGVAAVIDAALRKAGLLG